MNHLGYLDCYLKVLFFEGNKEECVEQYQIFEMTADIGAYENTNDSDDEGDNNNEEERKKDKQNKVQKSSSRYKSYYRFAI